MNGTIPWGLVLDYTSIGSGLSRSRHECIDSFFAFSVVLFISLCVWVFALHVCVPHEYSPPGDQKRVLDFMGLELQTVVSCHEYAGNPALSSVPKHRVIVPGPPSALGHYFDWLLQVPALTSSNDGL